MSTDAFLGTASYHHVDWLSIMIIDNGLLLVCETMACDVTTKQWWSTCPHNRSGWFLLSEFSLGVDISGSWPFPMFYDS